ncbi:MAG: pantoate kinase [Candidatus Hodarchaeales archaeon]|jgi:pantoate kinase
MIKEVSYWVASHLTGIFEIKDEPNDLLQQGSRGAGLSISRGVITKVSRVEHSNIEIFFDGIKKTALEAAVTSRVIRILLPEKKQSNLRIIHNFEVPISSGYGATAASALGTAFALNDLLGLEKSKLELFQVAHKAEVLTKSGLGDVIGLYQGGLEIRLKEGAPGIGKTMPFKNLNGWKVATVHLGTLSTSEVLSNPHKRKVVNNAGRELISMLISHPDFYNFIKLSAIFSEKVNLWSPRLQRYVKNLPETVLGSQIMLGEAFFVFFRDRNDLTQINFPITQINEETICQNTVVRCE